MNEPRRFLLCRGNNNTQVEADTVDTLTNIIGVHIYLYDTAEMLADEAWAGREATHGLITVKPVTE